jgi:small subunit ribosomal protein S1
MSDSGKQDNYYQPPDNLDAELQKELDEALGDMSIEQLMEQEQPEPSPQQAGGVRKGQVVSIQGDDIFIDLGGRSEGILPAQQWDEDEPLPEIGQLVEVTVEGFDSREGLMTLSRKGAVMAAAWDTLEKGQVVEGRVTGMNKGGLELDINGIRAFMPASQVDRGRVEDISIFLNERLRAVVSEIDRSARNVVVSRRDLMDREAAEQAEKTMATIAEGDTVTGTVRNIMPYGAFVDIGGVDGLLHVKDMSHSHVKDPNEVVKNGQVLELQVLSVDRENGKIGLGLKQVQGDPWQGVENKYAEGQLVSGRVTRLADFGAFVELEPGVEGLVPMSELSFERRIKSASDVVKEGDVIQVRVLSVDPVRRRISLSLKRAGEDPWVGASARWPVDSVASGVVTRIADFGAFVQLTEGVEGLVHISALSTQHVRAVGDVVREGDSVEAKVLEVDEDRRRISLSIKALQEGSESAAAPGLNLPEPTKRKKPLKGGLEGGSASTPFGDLRMG